MLNHELPFRLRVPLHSPILTYRTAKAPDIRGFVVSGVPYCPALSIPIHASDVHYYVHWNLNVHWVAVMGTRKPISSDRSISSHKAEDKEYLVSVKHHPMLYLMSYAEETVEINLVN